MKIDFLNEEQSELIKSLGYDIDKDEEYSDEEISDIVSSVDDHLAYYGFAEDDSITETGRICESILDLFGER